MIRFYTNKKNKKIYNVLSESTIDANNSASGDDLTVYYTDGTQIYHRSYKEFHEKFEFCTYCDDNYELLTKMMDMKKS